jgi:hypothetical protein
MQRDAKESHNRVHQTKEAPLSWPVAAVLASSLPRRRAKATFFFVFPRDLRVKEFAWVTGRARFSADACNRRFSSCSFVTLVVSEFALSANRP